MLDHFLSIIGHFWPFLVSAFAVGISAIRNRLTRADYNEVHLFPLLHKMTTEGEIIKELSRINSMCNHLV